LPDSTVEALRKIAESRGSTLTEALRQAIENSRYLYDAIEQGNKILVEKPDRDLREIVFR
jgi:hypothetical protein